MQNQELAPGAYSMRYSVLSKNAILASEAVKYNWIVILDAYEIARLRADAHPSHVKSYKFADCLHYCLPGVPDVYNEELQLVLKSMTSYSPILYMKRLKISLGPWAEFISHT